jgi:energy-coupling factor transport system permease protein
MTLHPSIRIIVLIMLAVCLQRLQLVPLTMLAAVLLILLVIARAKVYLQMMRRMRWLLLTMLLIYAFSTPGEYIAGWPFWLAPTYEGLNGGLLQALRLSMMLAGLALLITMTSRKQLIVGFFILLWPLRYLGLDPERFAARLWLTLHYVEQPQHTQTPAAMFEKLKHFHLEAFDEPPMTIQLDLPRIAWLDYLVLIALIGLGVMV